MDLNTYSLIINSFKNEHLFILKKLRELINSLVIQNTQNNLDIQETEKDNTSFRKQEIQQEIQIDNTFFSKQESLINLDFSSNSNFPCIHNFSFQEKEETLIILINFYQEYQEAFLNEINYLFKSLKLWELILCNDSNNNIVGTKTQAETKTKTETKTETKNKTEIETEAETNPENNEIEFRLQSIKLIKQDLENSNQTNLVLFNSYLSLI